MSAVEENVASIYDLREPDHYARVPQVLVFDKNAPDSAIRLYGVLDRFLNKKTMALFPGYKKIAEKTGFSKTTIARAVQYLEKERYIKVLRSHRKVNHYVLMPVKAWVQKMDPNFDLKLSPENGLKLVQKMDSKRGFRVQKMDTIHRKTYPKEKFNQKAVHLSNEPVSIGDVLREILNEPKRPKK